LGAVATGRQLKADRRRRRDGRSVRTSTHCSSETSSACSLIVAETRRETGASCPAALRDAWQIASRESLVSLRDAASDAPVRIVKKTAEVDLRGARGGGPRALLRWDQGAYRIAGQRDMIW
jgi:hypothetical protein